MIHCSCFYIVDYSVPSTGNRTTALCKFVILVTKCRQNAIMLYWKYHEMLMKMTSRKRKLHVLHADDVFVYV